MTAVQEETYAERNQRLLVAQLARVFAPLAARTGLDATGVNVSGLDVAGLDMAGPDGAGEQAIAPDCRLAQLVDMFRLSPFERDLLLWCAGVELESGFAPAFAAAHGDPHRAAPTFGLALATLDGAHWDALAPGGPLRRWRLVELGAGTGLVSRPLYVDERVLHFLAGVDCLDQRLDGVLVPVPGGGPLPPSQAAVADDVVALLDRLGPPVVLLIDGAASATRSRVAAHVAAAVGRLLLELPATLLPAPGPESASLAQLVEREVALLGGLLLVGYADGDDVRALRFFLDRLRCPALVGGVPHLPGRPVPPRRTVPELTSDERRAAWRESLGARTSARLGDVVAEVADGYRLDAAAIEALGAELAAAYPAGADAAALRRACRERARSSLDDLATRVEPRVGWPDLVLPDAGIEALRDIARQVRHRGLVHREWGMAARTGRGLGVTALFTGDSGTGKTLAAEVLAAELDLDLYRIDLAAVVSKYIGETEKNLKRVFDAAEAGGAVLLFDEADAVFGKRSEVKDSHDRYANLEISYLLQRMEAYRGLAVLTTNLRSAVDRAFLRRIGFVVTFPFPDAAARTRIWRLMLPPSLPVEGVDLARLARLQVSGGSIRNIALAAAFLAADRGGPVTMADLAAAARREYAKLEKPLTDTEIGGWA